MTPYADFGYFGLLLIPLVPSVLLGLAGRLSWRWIGLLCLAVLAVQYAGQSILAPWLTIQTLWLVSGYALFEWALARLLLLQRARSRSRLAFWTALLLALLPLVLAKFLPLLVPNTLFGFLGISYITFRALDVLFGIQDRLLTELPISQYLAFLFFFPTVSAGPIDRYRRFVRDWQQTRTRAAFLQDLDQAVQRIFRGLLYKFILASLIQTYWMNVAAQATTIPAVISYMYAYSLYLFFDFAGYSAFAIGISYIFGIHTPENFRQPFLAGDIREFWNRWHITLSAWFRDHVYMRFVLAATKGQWFKNKYLASALGFLLSMGLMGVWHGTAINYLLYGLYHGLLLTAHDLFSRWNKQHRLWGEGPIWRVTGIVCTVQLVCFGFLIFSGHLTSLIGMS